jgi:RNA ligase
MEITSWHSYPSIFALGHKATQVLVAHDDLLIEEKVDGSQFSFGVFKGEIRMKSKNAPMQVGYVPKMFAKAGETVEALADKLQDGWTYRAEAVCTPKHNVLRYDDIPPGGLIVFDINSGHDEYLAYDQKAGECSRLGLKCVPMLHRGKIDLDLFKTFLERESCLGGPKIEGVVIKPWQYDLYGIDKKVLMGKYVSEAFKEIHRKEWGASNPTGKDIVTLISEGLRTDARWQKALQSLREAGTVEGTPRDIGPLMKAVSDDLDKEVQDEVKELLFKHFWKDIKRSSMRGIPEWYKLKILNEAFEGGPNEVP